MARGSIPRHNAFCTVSKMGKTQKDCPLFKKRKQEQHCMIVLDIEALFRMHKRLKTSVGCVRQVLTTLGARNTVTFLQSARLTWKTKGHIEESSMHTSS